MARTELTMLGAVLVGVSAAAVAIVALAYVGQRRLMYFPDTTRTAPADIGLATVSEHVHTMPDGAAVITWWGRARPGQRTLVYFHGNGGALAAREPRIRRFMAEGWGVLMMAYRGYAGSTGSPTEADNVADAVRVTDWLVGEGVPLDRIVVYGESLGTGVATQVAAVRRVAGLILDAPYTSAVDVGAMRFPFLPVRAAMKDRYETRLHIRRVTAPVLVLHGRLDSVIPVDMGREVARIAGPGATFVEFPRAGHLDIYLDGNDALAHVRRFMRGLPD